MSKVDDEKLQELIERLSSPEVIKRGVELNRKFNNFSVEDLYKPFDI